jgi:hypothetical protein
MAILQDAQRVNPNEVQARATDNLDCIREGLGQLLQANFRGEGVHIGRRQPEKRDVSPAMA